MNYVKCLLPAAMIAALFTHCEDNVDPIPENRDYSKGIYVVNEGTFTQNNGSISYFDPDENLIINGIFEAVNGRPVGDVVQSFAVVNDSIGYIVVNHSGMVEIVRLSTFQTIAEPITIKYPRYLQQVSPSKAYLTAGSAQGYLHIVDLSNSTITDSVLVGFGPEVMLSLGSKVYIANSGGWFSDSTLSVVDTDMDEVIDTVHVAIGPVDMALDAQDNIWVYCKGYTNYADIETDAYLQQIDPDSKAILWQLKVGKALDFASTPARCASSEDGSTIYYLRPDGVYRINASSPQVQDEPFITGSFYGLDVNPADGNIFLFETSFTGNGKMKIYDNTGNLLSEGIVGIGPNGAVFGI
jgi:YVTN family beta-propeller protein